MKRKRFFATSIVCTSFIICCLDAYAQSHNSAAISQVSKAFSEWKLLQNDDEQAEKHVSSFIGEYSDYDWGFRIFPMLSDFQMRNWEMQFENMQRLSEMQRRNWEMQFRNQQLLSEIQRRSLETQLQHQQMLSEMQRRNWDVQFRNQLRLDDLQRRSWEIQFRNQQQLIDINRTNQLVLLKPTTGVLSQNPYDFWNKTGLETFHFKEMPNSKFLVDIPGVGWTGAARQNDWGNMLNPDKVTIYIRHQGPGKDNWTPIDKLKESNAIVVTLPHEWNEKFTDQLLRPHLNQVFLQGKDAHFIIDKNISLQRHMLPIPKPGEDQWAANVTDYITKYRPSNYSGILVEHSRGTVTNRYIKDFSAFEQVIISSPRGDDALSWIQRTPNLPKVDIITGLSDAPNWRWTQRYETILKENPEVRIIQLQNIADPLTTHSRLQNLGTVGNFRIFTGTGSYDLNGQLLHIVRPPAKLQSYQQTFGDLQQFSLNRFDYAKTQVLDAWSDHIIRDQLILGNIDKPYEAWAMGKIFNRISIVKSYENMGEGFNQAANVYRSGRDEIWMNRYATRGSVLGTSDVAKIQTVRGMNIYHRVSGITMPIIDVVKKGYDVFDQTITYAGAAMQTINPPRDYWHLKTTNGWETNKVVITNIAGGQIEQAGILNTASRGSISMVDYTRIQTTSLTLNRMDLTKMPADNFTRFMSHRFPQGRLWDPSATMISTTRIYEQFRAIQSNSFNFRIPRYGMSPKW